VSEPVTNVSDLWQGVKSHLTTDSRITPQLWGFLDLVEPRGVMAGVLYLEVPNELTRGMLEQRVRLPLLAALESTEDSGVSSFAIVVNPDIESDVLQIPLPENSVAEIFAESLEPPPLNAGTIRSHLNAKYNFDNFVIGSSNRFSHAAAVAVAEAPAKAYNPLFIYGGSGLGKTHLLHAIGHYAVSLFKGCRVRYVSSEEFTNDFINAIANNRAPQFQARYRDVEWGLITDVQAPDLETRIAILRKKASSERIDIGDDVMELMASKVSSNIRELEGALIRITAFSNLNKTPIDLQLAHTVLKDLVLTEDTNVVSPTDIITITATFYQLSIDDLYGSSRSQTIALARQVAMYLSREMTNLSLPKIGQLFGNRDHTTVMYANKKIAELMKERRSIYNQVTELTSRIKQHSTYAS